MTHRWPIRVYYEDTDLAGIVYYANYLRFIERARSEWLREAGVDQAALKAAGTVFAVRRLEAEYVAPARFDDLLTVETAVVGATPARLVLQQQVLRGPTLLFDAGVTVVAVGAAGLLATAVAQSAVDGQGVRLDAPVPLAVGSLLALLIAWWGPGGPSLRRGSRSLVRGVTGAPAARAGLIVVLCLFAVGVLGALAVGALDVSWWPSVSSPLPGPGELPTR